MPASLPVNEQNLIAGLVDTAHYHTLLPISSGLVPLEEQYSQKEGLVE
jgi:hypothetical protein